MKTFKLFLFGLMACFLTGCFEMNEEITVRENGSGSFSLNMDMGQLLEVMQAFMPAEELEKADINKVKDTAILMKDFIDTATAIVPENKAILRDGTLRMQMNMKEKLFKVNMQYPFTSMGNLQKLYEHMSEGFNVIGGLLKGLNANAPATDNREPDVKLVSSYFDIVANKNSITRKLNKEKYATLSSDSTMLQMKQMGEMGGGMGEVKMNTIIKLPAAAKKITGSKAELSSDKKIITLKNSLLDIFDHPEVFEFTVEY